MRNDIKIGCHFHCVQMRFLGIFVGDFWWINWEFLVGVFAWGFLGFLSESGFGVPIL